MKRLMMVALLMLGDVSYCSESKKSVKTSLLKYPHLYRNGLAVIAYSYTVIMVASLSEAESKNASSGCVPSLWFILGAGAMISLAPAFIASAIGEAVDCMRVGRRVDEEKFEEDMSKDK